MKITRQQLRKIISESLRKTIRESIMPGKFPMPRMPGDRFPGDEKPSPRYSTWGDSHPNLFPGYNDSEDPMVKGLKLSSDIFRTIMATDKKAIKSAIENGEDFIVPLSGSDFDEVKKALAPLANSPQVMLNEHPALAAAAPWIAGATVVAAIVFLVNKALESGYNVELEGNVSSDTGIGKLGPNRKDGAGGKIIFTKP